MLMINIARKELDNLPVISASGHNNGGTIYIKDDETLYKVFHNRYFFIDEKERNADFLIKASLSCPKPIDKIYIDGEFYGYSQPYIKNAKSFLAAIKEKAEGIDKKTIISDVFNQLQELHQYDVYLGDIHLDNFIFDESHGYIIDLDDIRFKGIDDFKFTEFYLLQNNKNSNMQKIADEKSDIMKTFICCLSFYYNTNLEQLVIDEGVDALFDFLDTSSFDKDIIQNMKTMWYENSELVYLNFPKEKKR